LELTPLDLPAAYQDRYLEAAGRPANLMEVLALTQVFEQRVFRQYRRHALLGETHPLVRTTLERIMADESWHLRWVGGALKRLMPDYGREAVRATLKRYHEADATVYRQTEEEQAHRLSSLRAA
ncbi:MAG TPA: hypothetical protein VKT70_13650, partial [Stellaceae bacterium]|nr:hypothetical protein [Stellaceae bacterium]